MRIALGIEYDGTLYNGWQRQRAGIGVQQRVEEALSRVADEDIQVVCAGRTDTGVHASAQVVHFDTSSERSERGWLLGANTNLPDDVSIAWARPVSEDFHARYSATSRSYEYRILNRLQRSALYRHRAWWVHRPLDEKRMQSAASMLVGEHDFSAFRAAGCQSSTAIREITSLEINRQGEWVSLRVSANAFLQHMVRNIAGTLVAVGAGDESPSWVGEVLAGRDRTRGGMAAPPHGLMLVAVDYPAEFGLPANAPAYLR
jgi:tRNA pseudouridine38-40 synthase